MLQVIILYCTSIPVAYRFMHMSVADSVNGAEACIGLDPPFAIRLPGGNLLCYTFQGQLNTTFVMFLHSILTSCIEL